MRGFTGSHFDMLDKTSLEAATLGSLACFMVVATAVMALVTSVSTAAPNLSAVKDSRHGKRTSARPISS
jgi:hypothetical protein